jgi:hypothetical protein
MKQDKRREGTKNKNRKSGLGPKCKMASFAENINVVDSYFWIMLFRPFGLIGMLSYAKLLHNVKGSLVLIMSLISFSPLLVRFTIRWRSLLLGHSLPNGLPLQAPKGMCLCRHRSNPGKLIDTRRTTIDPSKDTDRHLPPLLLGLQ